MNGAVVLMVIESTVEGVISTYPVDVRRKVLAIRELILDTAAATESIGPITETLKWGEPAYLTEKSKSGSTIRMGWKKSSPAQLRMYFICRTTLIDTFRTLFPELTYEGNRTIVFEERAELPAETIRKCIEIALTYHLSSADSFPHH